MPRTVVEPRDGAVQKLSQGEVAAQAGISERQVPNRIPPIDWNKSEREGIQVRLANFRAHRRRFESERKDHAAAELKRMWASRP
jgi:hypothetical protein